MKSNLFRIETEAGPKWVVLEPLDRLFKFQRDTFTFFRRCWYERDACRPRVTPCDRCAITYEAHFDHPQRCPAWMTDEVDRQVAPEPRLIF
jgi:hypothetical protein